MGHPRLADVLDDHAAGLSLTEDERHAILQYQSDRGVHAYGGLTYTPHNLINAHLRGIEVPGLSHRWKTTVARWVNEIQRAIAKSRLPIEVTAWRGLSNGTTVEWLVAKLDGSSTEGPVILDGLNSCSISRERAERFATVPIRVLLQLTIPAGTPALWVSGVGDEMFRSQRELLLDHETHVRLEPILAPAEDMVTVVGEVLT